MHFFYKNELFFQQLKNIKKCKHEEALVSAKQSIDFSLKGGWGMINDLCLMVDTEENEKKKNSKLRGFCLDEA